MASLEEIKVGIKSIKIQGATNVALAVLDAVKMDFGNNNSPEGAIEVGHEFSLLRPNEPLARNAIKYLQFGLGEGKNLPELIEEFKKIIDDSKQKIVEFGGAGLSQFKGILTHCHSSTSTAIFKRLAQNNKEFKIISTETRPLFQGRTTAKELFDAQVDVTMIVDSAAPSFIISDKDLDIQAVVIGADEIFMDGSFVNKVGSLPISIAANMDKDPLYVASTLLKVAFDKEHDRTIEMRDALEVWREAPENLKIINPSFDYVPAEYVTAFITESGIIKPSDIKSKTLEVYPWIS